MAIAVRRRDPSQSPLAGEPFRELAELQHATNSLIQSVLAGDAGVWSPPVDIEEREDAWVIEAELPGVSSDDMNVTIPKPEESRPRGIEVQQGARSNGGSAAASDGS